MDSGLSESFLDDFGVPRVLGYEPYPIQSSGMEVLAPHPGIVRWLPASSGKIADKGSAMCCLRYYKYDAVILSHMMGFCERIAQEGDSVQRGDVLFRIKF